MAIIWLLLQNRTKFFDEDSPVGANKQVKQFVDLKSNLALLNNKGHNFWKLFGPENQNWIFPY